MSFTRVLAGGAIAVALILPVGAIARSAPTMNSVFAQAMKVSDAHRVAIPPDPLANDLPGDSPVATSSPLGAQRAAAVTVTNGPVPDTPANRALYGKPMSHAGRATDPSGN